MSLPRCRIGLHHLAKGVAFSPASASARRPPARARQTKQAHDKYQSADDALCDHATRARYVTQEERERPAGRRAGRTVVSGRGGTPARSGTWLARGVVGLEGYSAAAPEKHGISNH